MCCSEHGQLFFIFQLNEKKEREEEKAPLAYFVLMLVFLDSKCVPRR